MEFIKKYIAPWALANEEIPIFISWKSDTHYNIEITLPEKFGFSMFSNVAEVDVKSENRIIIKKLQTDGNFGICIVAKDFFADWLSKASINIKFINEKETIETELIANIYRPVVSVENVPSEININDKNEIEPVVLKFRFKGFGNVYFKPEISTSGRFKIEKYSILTKLVQDILKGQSEQKATEKKDGKGITVDVSDELVDEMVNMIFHFDDNKEELFDFKEDTISEVIETIKMMPKEKLEELVHGYIQTYFMETILELMDRYPSDHVEISDSRQNIQIRPMVDKIKYTLRYKDALGKEYLPINGEIRIQYKVEKEQFIKIPIIVEIIPDIITDMKVLGGR